MDIRYFFQRWNFQVSLKDFSAISNMIEQNEQENVEYFSYMCRMITNGARRTREIKYRIVIVKNIFSPKKLDLNLRKKIVSCYTWSTAL